MAHPGERRIQQPIPLGLTASVELHAYGLAQAWQIGLSAADALHERKDHNGQNSNHHRAGEGSQHQTAAQRLQENHEGIPEQHNDDVHQQRLQRVEANEIRHSRVADHGQEQQEENQKA